MCGFSCAIKESLKGVVDEIFDRRGKARLGGVGKSGNEGSQSMTIRHCDYVGLHIGVSARRNRRQVISRCQGKRKDSDLILDFNFFLHLPHRHAHVRRLLKTSSTLPHL